MLLVSTTPQPLLPARADADGTHRRLLEAALVLFGDRGFHGVSVREIAEATGIRPSSMYAHLASKEQLLLELMLIGHE
ncbi:MAG: helix-turn-helix domain-containing protein [Candidatus Dormibacteria bacterium]